MLAHIVLYEMLTVLDQRGRRAALGYRGGGLCLRVATATDGGVTGGETVLLLCQVLVNRQDVTRNYHLQKHKVPGCNPQLSSTETQSTRM